MLRTNPPNRDVCNLELKTCFNGFFSYFVNAFNPIFNVVFGSY